MRLWILSLGFVILGCGIPEAVYMENTAPEISLAWPGDAFVQVPRGSGQMFTLCARDREGDDIRFQWLLNGQDQGRGSLVMCDIGIGTTFSFPAGAFTLSTSADVVGVAKDPGGRSISHPWIIYLQ